MRICIINTGGTISCVGTPLSPLPAARFADAAQDLLMPALAAADPHLRIDFHPGLPFGPDGRDTLDSTNLQPRDWCVMARAVLARYDDYDAFVILHGTDTMDFSGAALSFLLSQFDRLGMGRAVLSKPVILTGSQLPMFRDTARGLVLNAGSDAFANVAGAISAARLRLPEVALFFDGKLLRGNRALKVSSTRFAAFDSPHLPPLAEVGIGCRMGDAAPLPGPATPKVALDHPDARRAVQDQLTAIDDAIDGLSVIQLPAFPARFAGSPLAAMIRDAVDRGARAIVLEAYGEGNFPAGDVDDPQRGEICAALIHARDAGVLVVDGSRVIGGAVGAFHYAAGAWLAETGAVEAGQMTSVAAYAKALILCAAADHNGWDADDLRALIRRGLAGETPARDRMGADIDPVLRPGQMLQAADGAARLVNDTDAGLRLLDVAGDTVWAPAPGHVGQLRLDCRGLWLIARDGAVLWRDSGTEGPGAVLILRHDDGAPVLDLHHADGRVRHVAGFSGQGDA